MARVMTTSSAFFVVLELVNKQYYIIAASRAAYMASRPVLPVKPSCWVNCLSLSVAIVGICLKRNLSAREKWVI